MEAIEKEKQIESAEKKPAFQMDAEKEAQIFFPENEKVSIGGKEYNIVPLKLKQMRLLLQLSKIDLKVISDDVIGTLTNGIAEIIGEKDLAFIEENVDVPKVKEIFLKVRKVTYTGMPGGGTKKAEGEV